MNIQGDRQRPKCHVIQKTISEDSFHFFLLLFISTGSFRKIEYFSCLSAFFIFASHRVSSLFKDM